MSKNLARISQENLNDFVKFAINHYNALFFQNSQN